MWEDPEYVILEAGIDHDMVQVGLHLGIYVEKTVEDIAKEMNKPEVYVKEQLEKLAFYGVAFWNTDKKRNADVFWAETWIPGTMEVIVNSRENCEKYPIIGYAMEAYGRVRGPKSSGAFPVGVGLMRVIPIQTAIDGNSHSASYEEVSKYLEENDVFTVTDCSCRTDRELMGEGCGCLSLRTAAMFKNNDMVRSNYVARVDQEKCVACGQCVENCPVNALKLGQKICSTTKVVTDITTKITPRDRVWKEEYWNPDYRTNREDVVDSGTAPCKTNCPAHIAVQGYVKLASQGKYAEALELIRKENPLPAVCGRICNRRCEDACTRGNIDEPVAIDEIKKFIAQQGLDPNNQVIPVKRHDYSDKKIAIIGAGPAGLSCAYYLALDGYSITVFEKEAQLGGMLTLGIPSFRLEKDVVAAEIEIIKKMGVTFKTGIEVGKDVSLDELRQQGYRAFYLAIGAQGGRAIGIEGEDSQGAMSGIDFLKSINLDNSQKYEGKMVVIGGGNVRWMRTMYNKM